VELMMIPTLHLNGTSRDELMTQVCDAARALQAAMEALAQMAPNGRDYYVQSPDACAQAGREHRERIAKVKEVYDEVTRLGEAILDAPGRR
jgi:hypothetical protein